MSAEPEGRDFVHDMRVLIDAETANGSYATPIVAARIVAKLRATDPGLLAGWLDANAVSFVRDAIAARDRSERTHARQVAQRGVFGEAADSAARGDVAALGCFLHVRYVVDDEGMRKPLAQMIRADLIYVARSYEQDAREAKFEAQWFRALAKKIGAGNVADHFTEKQLAQMRTSFGRAA